MDLLDYFIPYPDTGLSSFSESGGTTYYTTHNHFVDFVLESPKQDYPALKKIDQVRFKVESGAWSAWENYDDLSVVPINDDWYDTFSPPKMPITQSDYDAFSAAYKAAYGSRYQITDYSAIRRRKFEIFLGFDDGVRTVYVQGINEDGTVVIDVNFYVTTQVEGVDPISPCWYPEDQTALTSRGTTASQVIGGTKPTTHKVIVNGLDPKFDLYEGYGTNWIPGNNRLDGYGIEWKYEFPLWFGSNPVRVQFVPKPFYDDGYQTTFLYEDDIFLERVYVPKQPGVTLYCDGYSIEGTTYEEEGYGAPPDAYGSTKTLFSCAQTQFPPKLRVKFLTNRELSSGVIVNGVERDGYGGYKKYFGLSPLFDGHSESEVVFSDGYGHYYTIRTDGYGDGYGEFRDPLRRYGTTETTVVEGEQVEILRNSKYDVYDEAENQVFVVSQAKNERHLLREGETLVEIEDEPEALDEIQIYREWDFETRESASIAWAFDPTRNLLRITPFDADGYGAAYARIAYTVAGSETSEDDPTKANPFPNNCRETPDGYGVNEDLLERDSLSFDFTTSLKKEEIGLSRNYAELLDDQTDHKMRMFFFKKNEFDVEMQLNPGFDIVHDERFARVGNTLNPGYYDNGKREIIVHVDYRGLGMSIEDGDGYGPVI